MIEAYIGIGSNVGDRQGNIEQALKLLAQESKIKEISALYETEPEGFPDQPDFLNCVVRIETAAGPFGLLKIVKGIEEKLGRTESFRNAPRPIDLDILFYGDDVISGPGLGVPHPRLHLRAFVLTPMAEIAPDLIHPIIHKTIRRLLDDLKPVKKVCKWGEINVDFTGS